MRRPDTAGGGCAEVTSPSQRLSSCVGTRRFQTSWMSTIACIRRSSPSPVRPETPTTGTPLTCGSAWSASSRSLRRCRRRPLAQVPFADADHQRAALALDQVGDPQVLLLERLARHSISSTTTSAKRMALMRVGDRELLELLLHLRPAAAGRRCRTGGSARPCQSRSTAMVSRVMPASGPVSSRSSPSSRLISVDLPEFGRPTTATRIGRVDSAWLRTSLVPAPAVRSPPAAPRAAPRNRSASPSPCSAEIAPARRARAHRLRPRRRRPPCPRPCWRPRSRACRSAAPGRRRRGRRAAVRSRASIRKNTASACSIAALVCASMRPARLCGPASSRPAVSITVNSRSPSRASPSRRSRVTPGRSSTSASRRPTSRLNSVDLPTFGRPTMATVKLMGLGCPRSPRLDDSATAISAGGGSGPAQPAAGCCGRRPIAEPPAAAAAAGRRLLLAGAGAAAPAAARGRVAAWVSPSLDRRRRRLGRRLIALHQFRRHALRHARHAVGEHRLALARQRLLGAEPVSPDRSSRSRRAQAQRSERRDRSGMR